MGTVKKSLPWDPIGKKKRSIGTIPEEKFRPMAEVAKTAMDRYQLPLAIYISHNHAKLVIGSSGTPAQN